MWSRKRQFKPRFTLLHTKLSKTIVFSASLYIVELLLLRERRRSSIGIVKSMKDLYNDTIYWKILSFHWPSSWKMWYMYIESSFQCSSILGEAQTSNLQVNRTQDNEKVHLILCLLCFLCMWSLTFETGLTLFWLCDALEKA